MKRTDFIQSVTRTKVLETRLLKKDIIDRMIESDETSEALKVLSETEYSGSLKGVSSPADYERILSNELVRVYELMREISPNHLVVDLLALRYDYHNLKVMIKGKLYNKFTNYLIIPVGTVPTQVMNLAYNQGDYSQIPREFKLAIEDVEKDFELNQDSQRIDLLLDNHYFNHLFNMAKETEIDLFINYVKDMIDFINISTLIRLRKQNKDISFAKDVILENGNIKKDYIIDVYEDPLEDLIEGFKDSKISESLVKGLNSYQKTGRLSNFEKYKDNYLMDLNLPSKNINIGPEPIFSYIIAKEAEIKTLRIIFVAKINKLSPNVIRERVRELYV